MNLKPVIHKSQPRLDGKFNIKIRISHNRKVRYLSTSYYVYPEQFDKAKGEINHRKHPNAYYVNVNLGGMIQEMEAKLLPYANRLEGMSMNTVLSIIRSKSSSYDFFTMIDNQINKLKTLGKPNASEVFERTRNMVIKYYGDAELDFIEITPEWLSDFQFFLLQNDRSINTVGVHMRNIRIIYNRAIDMGIIGLDTYPFRRYKIPKEATRKRSLLIEHIQAIKNIELSGYEEQARDIFMLSFYLIGINLKDLLFSEKNERGRLMYKRSKTGKEYSILVQQEAMELFGKYRGEKLLLWFAEHYQDYRNVTKMVNKKLRIIARKCGIDDRITTYSARHSWATIASKIGIPRDVIRQALGHGLFGVTDIYIDFDMAKVDEANRKVIDTLQ